MRSQDSRFRQRVKIIRTTLAFGVLQLITGLIVTTISFAAFGLTSSDRIRNTCPYWAGFTIVLSGGVGVIAYKQPSILSMGFFTFLSSICVVLQMIGTILTGDTGGILKSLIFCENDAADNSCSCCDSVQSCNQRFYSYKFEGVEDCNILRGLVKEIMYGLCVLNIFGCLVCFVTTIFGCTSVARYTTRDQSVFRRRRHRRQRHQPQYTWVEYPDDPSNLPPCAPPAYHSVDNLREDWTSTCVVPPPVFDPTDLPPPYSSREPSETGSRHSLALDDHHRHISRHRSGRHNYNLRFGVWDDSETSLTIVGVQNTLVSTHITPPSYQIPPARTHISEIDNYETSQAQSTITGELISQSAQEIALYCTQATCDSSYRENDTHTGENCTNGDSSYLNTLRNEHIIREPYSNRRSLVTQTSIGDQANETTNNSEDCSSGNACEDAYSSNQPDDACLPYSQIRPSQESTMSSEPCTEPVDSCDDADDIRNSQENNNNDNNITSAPSVDAHNIMIEYVECHALATGSDMSASLSDVSEHDEAVLQRDSIKEPSLSSSSDEGCTDLVVNIISNPITPPCKKKKCTTRECSEVSTKRNSDACSLVKEVSNKKDDENKNDTEEGNIAECKETVV